MTTAGNVRFRMVAPTIDTWNEYTSWYTLRSLPCPKVHSDGIFVADAETGLLLSACLIFPTAGPFAVVEYAATNPRVLKRYAHAAMAFGAEKLMEYGASRGMAMLCFPSSHGMAKLLERAGFVFSAAPTMQGIPWPK